MFVKRAEDKHVEGISKVCREGCLDTYKNLRSQENIERNNRTFYNYERIRQELFEQQGWDGYYVAVENDEVVGAIGGGMTGKTSSEVYVLYLDPSRRGEGIGSKLLEELTSVQQRKGASEQWVSVQKGNYKGIPFYEARGFEYVEERPTYSNEGGEGYVSLRYKRRL
ncbi:GNAT family N-acetyltransferase [Salimicrobium flavidum]|uniref:Ribosomal protein S18 acetylase RimI n=1 Tax=Salimicrobium flavidum TaxID=570947 RepID=A0A1N7J8W4_9BACI|nr:GNAT family N-acetyltransferase [Salimicrobium flavidum]SIS45744.1 Ribosomal protein S18 acetylase RimI [Salimicrobium flavidum]